MNASVKASACDPRRLEAFLKGDLSDSQEGEFLRHLNTCLDCRRSLQQQAAEPESWMEAERLLQPCPFDGPPPPQPLPIQSVLGALGPTDDPQMLGRLGGYEVSGVVGSGGMGVVLKAIDKSLDRTVAIKVLAPHLASSGAARKRFAREAKVAAAVLHPNVIAIHSVSNDEALPYLVMPYVRGPSLQKRLDEQGPLALQEILRIGSQVAAGLAAAHTQGLVHRDVTPANILLEEGVERVTITDFGLARTVDDATITRSGVIAGTPQYMSPEQARGEAVDPRSDLFSLGSLLYAICTGRPPFRAETTYGVIRRIIDDEPTPIRQINPEIPQWLCQIIARLVSKRPGDRFESASEVAELLKQCLAHVHEPTAVPLPPHCLLLTTKDTPRTARAAWTFRAGVIAMIAALSLGLFGALAWLSADPPDISGQWTGDDWGQVVLKKQENGTYEGTYTDTYGQEAGKLELTWSAVEHRFKGTWREGKDRSGKIAVRLVDGEIRGAWTTDKESRIQPGTPELADLLWQARHDAPKTPPGKEADKPKSDDDRLQGTWEFASWTQGGKTIQREDLGEKDGRPKTLRFIGDKVLTLMVNGDGKEVEFTYGFKLDPSRKPKEIDLTPEGKNKGQSGPGIYELVGDTLRVCFEGQPDQERPTRLESKEGDSYLLLTYRRVAAEPLGSQPKTTTAMPRRLNHFTTGHGIKVACSADGQLIAVANGNPTRILQVGGTSRLKGDWKPSAEILDIATGKTVVALKLTTADEEAVLAATERITHVEATALAFSPVEELVAIGTSIGQVKLFHSRTGELIRSLDDEQPRLADKETPENWKPLKRAMGSVASLAFSPDGSLLAVCGTTFREYSDVFDGISGLSRAVKGPGRLKLWDVKTGTLKHDLAGHSHAHQAAFSADGTFLASAGNWSGEGDNGTGVIVWNSQTGAKLRTIATEANGGAHSVVFSPTKKLVAIGSWHYDKENDTRSTSVSVAYALSGITEWQRTIAGGASPITFSSDGKSVLALCGGQSIQAFDTDTGSLTSELKAADSPDGGPWLDFALAGPGSRLAIGGVSEEEGSVVLWNMSGLDAAKAPQR